MKIKKIAMRFANAKWDVVPAVFAVRRMILLWLMVSICAGLWSSGSPLLVAQETKPQLAKPRLAKPQPAAIAFQMSPAKIMASDPAVAMRLDQVLGDQHWIDYYFILRQAESLVGIIHLPESLEDWQNAVQDPYTFPLEFYGSAKLEEKKFQELKTLIEGSTAATQEGEITYYHDRQEGGVWCVWGPENTFTVGSAGYRYNPQHLENIRPQSAALMQRATQGDLRMVCAFDGSKALIDQIIARQPPNPSAEKDEGPLLRHLQSIQIIGDLEAEVLATIGIEAKTNEAAQAVEAFLQSKLQVDEQQLPNASNRVAFKKIVDAIKIRNRGKSVTVELRMPEGLDAILLEERRIIEVMQRQQKAMQSIHNYYEVHRCFPFQTPPGMSEQLSWRVRVLAEVGEADLQRGFDLEQPWNSDNNQRFAEFMPKVFGEGEMTDVSWIKSDVTDFKSLTDGSSNTIAFIENPHKVPWTQNNDLTPADAIKLFMSLEPGQRLIITRYDGSVEHIGNEVSLEAFSALLTPGGGEVLPPD